jgi:hypothetical protein
VHTPPAQLSPTAHVRPQDPQFRGSVAVFVQTPEQYVWPIGQGRIHAPLKHISPASHIRPHIPQCRVSVFVSTHIPLQAVGVGGEHTSRQLPIMHTSPGRQARMHAPQ